MPALLARIAELHHPPGGAALLGLFALQLGTGLTASLALISPAQVAQRFYRTQFLIVLGTTTLAVLAFWSEASAAVRALLAGGIVFAFLGSFVWGLEGAPGGRLLIGLEAACLLGGMALAEWEAKYTYSSLLVQADYLWITADNLAGAALLGTATSAMLMGHSYLIAPAMAITPLLRLLGAMFAATLGHALVCGLALVAAKTAWPHLATGTWLMIGIRWAVGFGGPLVLGGMALQAARIRSTQSATGILYVVVVFCFIGELLGQVLRSQEMGALAWWD